MSHTPSPHISEFNSLQDSDRYNVNKFLNRLLGMEVETQNALFGYYMQVFRWVVVTAKAQGRAEPAVETVSGESVREKVKTSKHPFSPIAGDPNFSHMSTNNVCLLCF